MLPFRDLAQQFLTDLVLKPSFFVPKSFEIHKALVFSLPFQCLATSYIPITPPSLPRISSGRRGNGLQNTTLVTSLPEILVPQIPVHSATFNLSDTFKLI